MPPRVAKSPCRVPRCVVGAHCQTGRRARRCSLMLYVTDGVDGLLSVEQVKTQVCCCATRSLYLGEVRTGKRPGKTPKHPHGMRCDDRPVRHDGLNCGWKASLGNLLYVDRNHQGFCTLWLLLCTTGQRALSVYGPLRSSHMMLNQISHCMKSQAMAASLQATARIGSYGVSNGGSTRLATKRLRPWLRAISPSMSRNSVPWPTK